MKSSEAKRFATLYERQLKLLNLQSKGDSTISAYSLLSEGSESKHGMNIFTRHV